MAEPVRQLHPVPGEVPADAPSYGQLAERNAELERLLEIETGKLQGAWLEIERLKKLDPATAQRQHERHDEAVALHADWQRATRHPRTSLDYGKDSRCERYLWALEHAERRVKKEKPLREWLAGRFPDLDNAAYARILCRLAFAGAGFDPYERENKNGSVERYDDPTTIFKNAASFQRHVKRAPADAFEWVAVAEYEHDEDQAAA